MDAATRVTSETVLSAGRIRRLRTVVERPADAWLACRMAAWAAVLPVLKRVVRLETLARLMWSDPSSEGGATDIGKVVTLSRLLTRQMPDPSGRCYERSLLAYRFLSQRGANPRLVVAVKNNEGTMAGHAWVTVGGSAVGESETIEEFVPLVVYGRRGRPEE